MEAMRTPPQSRLICLILATLAWVGLPGLAPPLQAAESGPVRLLLVTGGHDYETNAFHRLFREMPGVSFTHAEHPRAHAHLKVENRDAYDVIVLYDMWQPISDAAKQDFLQCLRAGKGLVALHHSLASYQNWPDYARIIGGKYNLEKRTEAGREIPASTYLHDVKFKVKVAAPQHPVTRELRDFEIHDETYGRLSVDPGVEVLLTTEEATSHPQIAWAHRIEGTRVACIQLGHDHLAYENPSYQRLVRQAILWTAGRQPTP
jgi:hypothetical protein